MGIVVTCFTIGISKIVLSRYSIDDAEGSPDYCIPIEDIDREVAEAVLRLLGSRGYMMYPVVENGCYYVIGVGRNIESVMHKIEGLTQVIGGGVYRGGYEIPIEYPLEEFLTVGLSSYIDWYLGAMGEGRMFVLTLIKPDLLSVRELDSKLYCIES